MEHTSNLNQYQYACEVVIPIDLEILVYIDPIIFEIPATCVQQKSSTESVTQSQESFTPQQLPKFTTETQQIQLTEPLQVQLTESLQAQLTQTLQVQLTESLQAQLTQPLQVQTTDSSQLQATKVLQFQPNKPLQFQFTETSPQISLTELTEPQQLQLTTTPTRFPLKHRLLLPRMTIWQLLIASLLSISLLLIAQNRLSTGIFPYIQTLQTFDP
jgi:hypothetical protein